VDVAHALIGQAMGLFRIALRESCPQSAWNTPETAKICIRFGGDSGGIGRP
jgi:hypothetical protein